MVLRNGTPEEAGMSSTQISKMEKMVDRWVEEGYSPSMTYLVARNGIIVSHGAAGVSEPDKNSSPLTSDTTFPLASITKIITATAIMMLTEDGILSPVTPVHEIISEFKGEGKEQILIHHLLTHISGLTDADIIKFAKNNADTLEIPRCEETQNPYIHKKLYSGFQAPLSYKTGEKMDYCNYGYELLGEIVRRKSGVSLDHFFRERIFEPLNMKNTFLIVPDEEICNTVKFPKHSIAGEWRSTTDALKSPSACGGVYSNVYDMAIFGQMFLNEGIYGDKRILSKASVLAMIRNHTLGIPSSWGDIRFPESGWGLGFMISINKKDETGTLRSPESFSHSGFGCTYIFIDPVYNVVINFFQVTTPWEYERLNRRFDIFTDVALAAIEA
jgi:CubicO group peptidase (beta-lactamase class C family)